MHGLHALGIFGLVAFAFGVKTARIFAGIVLISGALAFLLVFLMMVTDRI